MDDIVIICTLPVINHLLPRKRRIISNLEERRNFTTLIKILLTYIQITILVGKIDIELPFDLALQFNNADPNQLIYSLDCTLIPIANATHIPLIYVRFICEISLPIFLFVIFILQYRIEYRNNRLY